MGGRHAAMMAIHVLACTRWSRMPSNICATSAPTTSSAVPFTCLHGAAHIKAVHTVGRAHCTTMHWAIGKHQQSFYSHFSLHIASPSTMGRCPLAVRKAAPPQMHLPW